MDMYVVGFKRYYWVILVCTLLASITGLIVIKSHPLTFQASAILLVDAPPPGSNVTTIAPTADPLQSLAEANTYAAEIPSRSVMEFIYQMYPQLEQRGFTLNKLLADVSASPSTSAAIITITATASTPNDALLAVNDVAQGFQTYIQKRFQGNVDAVRHHLQDEESKYQQDEDYWGAKMQASSVTDINYTLYSSNHDQAVRSVDAARAQLLQLPATVPADVSVTQLAALSDVTSTTHIATIIAVTLGVGLCIGILVMLLAIMLDDRLFTGEQVKEKLGMAYLGNLSHNREIVGCQPLPASAQCECADIYANLHLTGVLPYDAQNPKSSVLLITSTRDAEGRTTLAAALAVEVARNGETVIVVDGNLAQPSTHLAFSMNMVGPGLSGLLQSTGSVRIEHSVLRSNIPGVWVLPGGPQLMEPAGLLEQKLPDILAQMCKKTDVVIIDGPPLLSGAEASVMATMVDSIALVVDTRHSKQRLLLRAKELLNSLAHVPTGVILNHLPKGRHQYFAVAYPKTKSVHMKETDAPVVPVLPITTSSGGLITPLRLPAYSAAARQTAKTSLLRPTPVANHTDSAQR